MSERQLAKHPRLGSKHISPVLMKNSRIGVSTPGCSLLFNVLSALSKKTSQLDVKQLSAEQLDVELCGLTLISNLSSN